jgi:hypothetical protein
MNKILNNGLIGGQTSEEEPRINNNKSLIALSETESSIVPPSNINIINMTAGTIHESTIPAGTITESTIPAGTITESTIPATTNKNTKINPIVHLYEIKPITNTIASLPTTSEEKIKDLKKQLTKLQENYEFEKNRLDEEIRRLQQDTAPVSVPGPFGTVLTTETAQPGVSTEQDFLHKILG